MDTSLNNTAVLFVDIINDFDFDGGDDLYRNTKAILPNLIKLKKFAKEKNLPTIQMTVLRSCHTVGELAEQLHQIGQV